MLFESNIEHTEQHAVGITACEGQHLIAEYSYFVSLFIDDVIGRDNPAEPEPQACDNRHPAEQFCKHGEKNIVEYFNLHGPEYTGKSGKKIGVGEKGGSAGNVSKQILPMPV